MFTKHQLTNLVQDAYERLDEERANRVFAWIADPNVRQSVSKFAEDAISAATKAAVELAVARCSDTVKVRIDFGQHVAQMLVQNPALGQNLSAPDIVYAFRSLLQEQDFILDEDGVLLLSIPIGEISETEPVPAPEPDPVVTLTDEHRTVVQKGVKDLVKEINAGTHDSMLLELIAAENEHESPRSGVLNTLRTRHAWIKGQGV